MHGALLGQRWVMQSRREFALWMQHQDGVQAWLHEPINLGWLGPAPTPLSAPISPSWPKLCSTQPKQARNAQHAGLL